MKKILSLVIFGLFLSLGLTSCKGDSPEPPMPPAAQGKKLVGYVDSEGITIKTIKYDTRGRIIFVSDRMMKQTRWSKVISLITIQTTASSSQ